MVNGSTVIARDDLIAGDVLTGPEIALVLGRAHGLPGQFRPLPIEQLRGFDPQVAAMFEWFDRRTGGEPDLSELRALHPGLWTLAAWVAGQPDGRRGNRGEQG
jgi:hypothetical protein